MEFYTREFLTDHIRSILAFYMPNVLDENGGYFQNYKDDGTVFNAGQRHLVSSCRMVFNFCKAFELFGDQQYLEYANHGLEFVRSYHWDENRQGYNWTLREGRVADDTTNHCYGLAFVMLCSSAAYEVGIDGARQDIDNVYSILEKRFWDASFTIYADEASPDWSVVDSYRGQNANMHCCEALIAAYEATGETRFLDRAYLLAKTVAVNLAGKSEGLVWEHFTQALDIDWHYNKNDPKNLYRPWGFQPGHQTEWTKLLLIIYQHRPEAWMLTRAKELFDYALDVCWDKEYGGILYGFSPDREICDSDKYFWVQAESFAASARLLENTGDTQYRQWYEKIWQYAWEHFVDHNNGAWYRVLTRDNKKHSDEKSIAGGKCDYHTIGACWDVLRGIDANK